MKKVNIKTPVAEKNTGKKEHKVPPGYDNSGYDNERNDYRSSQHKDGNDASSKITSEGNTHRSGQSERKDNNNEDDKDSMYEKNK
jgi:hypothetical protein